MEYEEYRISKKERLEDLAWRFKLTIKELQELNPQLETFNNFWGTQTFAVVNQVIKVPEKEKKTINLEEKLKTSFLVNENYKNSNEKVGLDFGKSQKEKEVRLPEQENLVKSLTFDQEARYRCEQVNISKVNGNTVHFVEQKFQYLLKNNLEQKIGYVKLEEHLYNFSPPILNLFESPSFYHVNRLRCCRAIFVKTKSDDITQFFTGIS